MHYVCSCVSVPARSFLQYTAEKCMHIMMIYLFNGFYNVLYLFLLKCQAWSAKI